MFVCLFVCLFACFLWLASLILFPAFYFFRKPFGLVSFQREFWRPAYCVQLESFYYFPLVIGRYMQYRYKKFLIEMKKVTFSSVAHIVNLTSHIMLPSCFSPVLLQSASSPHVDYSIFDFVNDFLLPGLKGALGPQSWFIYNRLPGFFGFLTEKIPKPWSSPSWGHRRDATLSLIWKGMIPQELTSLSLRKIKLLQHTWL